MNLDRNKSYATIYGHSVAVYEQNGVLFDGAGCSISEKKQEQKKKDLIIQHDGVENAKEFLLNVLRSGPLSKSAVYKVAGDNNQAWDNIKDASQLLGIVKYQFQKSEMWKLSETITET